MSWLADCGGTAGMIMEKGKAVKISKAKERLGRPSLDSATDLPQPKHKTIADEWRAMGPFSKIMAVLGLFGFIVGIPGWLSSEYWMGKDPTVFLVPPAIAERLNPQQVAQLTEALASLQQTGGSAGSSRDQVGQALAAANQGNLKLAEGLLEEVYKKSATTVSGAQAEQALAARHLAALLIVGDAGKALSLYKQATELDPSAKEGWLGLGDAARVSGTLSEAEDAFRRYLALVPAEIKTREHSAGLDRLGDVLMSKGDITGAQQAYELSIELARKLAERDPSESDLQRNYAVGVKKLGDLHAAAGAFDKALSAYQDAIKIMQSLANSDLDNAEARRVLSTMLNDAGDMEVRLNHAEEALNAYSDGLRLVEMLVTAAPNDVRRLRDLAVSYVKIADVKAGTNDQDAALAALSKALAIREDLSRKDAANGDWQRDLAVCLIKIGNVELTKSKIAEALNSFAQSVSIFEKLAGQDPTNLDLQRDLSVGLGKVGDAQKAAGQLDEASASHARGLTIVVALARRVPENAELQRDVVIGHFKLAEDGAQPLLNMSKALEQAQLMQSQGILGPVDQWMIDDLKQRLAALPKT